MQVADCDVTYKTKSDSSSIGEQRNEPAAKAAAARISSCSAENNSIACAKISCCGDMSLFTDLSDLASPGRGMLNTYMKRPSSPRMRRLRTTREGLALLVFC